MPQVSIVVPIYNVEPYLRECLDSIVNQTLKDIEIICVNDGSKDNSLAIVQEYAEKDSRIKIISKPNSGYGHTMNVGFDAATGEYIGIVESDDFVSVDMYEKLYQYAKSNDLDIAKGNFNYFKGEGEERKYTKVELRNDRKYNGKALYSKEDFYNKVFNPRKETKVFRTVLHTWAGIYKKSYLEKNRIRHNETPGASYQDNGFFFLSYAFAQRVGFLEDAFYQLRRDNPESSVNNKAKVYCGAEEYKYIKNVLLQYPDLWEILKTVYSVRKNHNYNYTCTRIDNKFRYEFLHYYSNEFSEAIKYQEIDWSLFDVEEKTRLLSIIEDPEKYYFDNYYKNREKRKETEKELSKIKKELDTVENSVIYRIGRGMALLPKFFQKTVKCYSENGMKYTLNKIKEKVLG